MKVMNRAGFLKMPEGTIYTKGVKWAFGRLCIKGESLEDDWIYLDPAWISAHDSGEAADRLEKMLEGGASYPAEDAWGRDGRFDAKEIFLVFERDDLRELRGHIDRALTL